MQIPRGNAGQTLISEVPGLEGLCNCSKKWQPVAIYSASFLSTRSLF